VRHGELCCFCSTSASHVHYMCALHENKTYKCWARRSHQCSDTSYRCSPAQQRQPGYWEFSLREFSAKHEPISREPGVPPRFDAREYPQQRKKRKPRRRSRDGRAACHCLHRLRRSGCTASAAAPPCTSRRLPQRCLQPVLAGCRPVAWERELQRSRNHAVQAARPRARFSRRTPHGRAAHPPVGT